MFPPALCGRSHLQPLCVMSRHCFSTGDDTLHSRENTYLLGKSSTELSVRDLLDLGFSNSQADHVYETVCKARGGSTAKHVLATLSALFVLGLNPSNVLKLLEKCPEVYTVKESQLQQRIGNLRKLGLVEGKMMCFKSFKCQIITALYKLILFTLFFFPPGSLQRVVAHHPQILTIKMKKINNVVLFLKEKCLFTSQQVTDILRDSPAIIHEDLNQLEYKFQVRVHLYTPD